MFLSIKKRSKHIIKAQMSKRFNQIYFQSMRIDDKENITI